jgi:hypothetical protein
MRVVVSLTTIPSRLPHLDKVFTFLAAQTVIPDVTYLAIPSFSKKENCKYPKLSEEVVNLGKQVNLQVLECEDLGPITKLVPCLKEENDLDTFIITLDDDNDYHPSLLEELISKAIANPGMALGTSGRIVGHGNYTLVKEVTRVTPVDIIQGASASLYVRKFFNLDELLNYEGAPSGAFYHDDVWISGYLSQKGIPRMVIPTKKLPTEVLEVANINPLSKGITFTKKLLPLLVYFKRKGAFRETNVKRTSKWTYLLLLIIVVVILLLFLR